MEILLLILKIVGIFLLVLIGIFLFLILSIIFIPVRYRISGKGEFPAKDNIEADAIFGWFLHLIYCRIKYDKDGLILKIRIFGIPLRLGMKSTSENNKESEPEFDKSTDDRPSEEKSEILETIDKAGEYQEKNKEKVFFRKKRYKKKNRKNQLLQNLKVKIVRVKNKITNIKSIFLEETNKNAYTFLLKEFKYLLKYYTPRKASGTLQYGMGDPANTGQILGLISLFPFWYRYKISVMPDFETEHLYARGDFIMKGRIRSLHLLTSGIRFIKNRDMRKFIKYIKK